MLPKLIVFARAPVAGRVKTRLASELSPHRALEFHVAMTSDLLSRLKQVRAIADVELHTDEITQTWNSINIPVRVQASGDLGRRLYRAISQALEAGHSAAIVVGSDSPTFPLAHLSALLDTHAGVALGPTPDGGFYAILCRRTHPEMFDGVTWSSADTRAETERAIRRCGLTVAIGPEWYDVDTAADLSRLAEDPDLGPATRLVLERSGRMPGRDAMRISVIIPVLNEETCIRETLDCVTALKPHEIIVADGGSTDSTLRIASGHAQIVHSLPGRGAQQRKAAEDASGDVLWFLHADTLPGPGALDGIRACLSARDTAGGNFSLRFDGDSRAARQLTRIYPALRRLGLCYGDSGIFVRRTAYQRAGGFKPYPLFEDLDLVRRIRKIGRFRTLSETLFTSSRRFEHRNFTLMFAEWTALQALYWAGVSPHRLAMLYRPVRKPAASAID